ncbi:MAG: tetratricopeptide repeat protein [Pirellulales bacterium]|nr:tetratricopeptide repeat protein [Pirellulales bacterium]
MEDKLARRRIVAALVLVTALAAANLAPRAARADAGDDQYAVAAGHYARQRWPLAIEEFETFLTAHPQHARTAAATFFLGEALVHAERYAAARERFQQYLQAQPDGQHVQHAQFRSAESAYLVGDRDAALRELQAFQSRYPDDEWNAFVLTYLGDLALADKDHAGAARHYEQSIERFPEGPLCDDCRYGLGRAWQELGQFDKAEPIFRSFAEQRGHPLSDESQFQLGACRYSAGDYVGAETLLADFDHERSQSAARAKTQLARGWALFHLERYDEAEALFAALTEHPQWGLEASYWLGLVAKAEGQWSSAAERLQACAARAGDAPLAAAIHFHAGDALIRSGNPAAGVEELDRCEAVDSGAEWADDCQLARIQAALADGDHELVGRLAHEFDEKFATSDHAPEAARAVARSLLNQREFTQAIARLSPWVADAGANSAPADRYLLALAFQGAGRHAEAVAALAELPDDDTRLRTEADLVEGTSLAALERYDEAIARLERYLAARGDEEGAARCRAQLAVCSARAKRIDDARHWFNELQAKHAGDAVLRHATSHLAEAVYAAGEFAWSAELFEQVSKLGGDSPSVEGNEPAGASARGLAGLAWSRYQQGDLAAAAAEFARVVEQFPADPAAAEAALMLGRIEAERGAPARGLASYKQVIEQFPDSPHLADALRGAARLHEQLGDHNEAAALYQRLDREFPAATDRDALLYEWSWVERGRQDDAVANALLERLHVEHPQSRFVADALYRLAERAHQARDYDRASRLLSELSTREQVSPSIEEHALYLQGQLAAAREQWTDVEAPLAALLEKHPESSLRLLAEYWCAEASYRLGQTDVALERFEVLLTKTLDSKESWAPMVALRRAQIFAGRREWDEAYEMASQIAGQHPGFAQQYEVDYLIGRCHASQARFEDARGAYALAVSSATGGKTETAAMAQWMIGETHFHQRNYRAAIREYLRVEILYAYPEWQAAALLQAAKCHEQLHEPQQAAQLYTRLVEQFGQTSYAEEATARAKVLEQKTASLTSPALPPSPLPR